MAELPFDPAKLDAQGRAICDSMAAQRASQGTHLAGPYLALMNHPKLCQRIEELGFYLKFEGHLPREIYEFVVLAVARETKAGFMWADHVEHARAAGIPEPVLEALRASGVSHTDFPDPYRAAALLLRSTLPWQDIPSDVQSNAIRQYGMYSLIEIVVLSGFYQMFAAINQGFAVALPPGVEAPFHG